MYFLDQQLMAQLWAEVREQVMKNFRKDPEQFSEQIDRLCSHSILSSSEVTELLGSQSSGRKPM